MGERHIVSPLQPGSRNNRRQRKALRCEPPAPAEPPGLPTIRVTPTLRPEERIVCWWLRIDEPRKYCRNGQAECPAPRGSSESECAVLPDDNGRRASGG